ncbi:hypothetical protein AB1Y20_015040 [Prymnesium parvum]|uniref:Fe2OG dioxygenase domain-containing protein n=1 Tax=Prymnesium parvum TaxID=97485 RepID=A0AB34JWM8_PRYPA
MSAGRLLLCVLSLRGLAAAAPTGWKPPAPSSWATYRDAWQACTAVALQPRSHEHWRRLGKLLHGKGRLSAARAALTHAGTLDARSAASRVELANVLRSAGLFAEAAEALREAEAIGGTRDQSLRYYGAPATAWAPVPEAPPAATPSASPHVWVTRLAGEEECVWAIAKAEEFNSARGGWGNPPPRYAPAGTEADAVRAPHMLAADCPELLSWFNGKLQATVWPLLSAQFGEAAARDMWLYDAFILKFDQQPGRAGLGLHVDDDGLGISINVLLSSPDDFEGGGTFFQDDEVTITPQQGEMVSHHGGLRHASVPTTSGLRYILVAFLRSPTLISNPPPYVSRDNVCQATMHEAAAFRTA